MRAARSSRVGGARAAEFGGGALQQFRARIETAVDRVTETHEPFPRSQPVTRPLLGTIGAADLVERGAPGGRAEEHPDDDRQRQQKATQGDHHSIIRVTYGVMPLVRTGEILTTEPV